MLDFEFPPLNDLLRWRDIIPSAGFNKVSVIVIFAALVPIVLLFLAGRVDGKAPPRGVRAFVEMFIDFIEREIIIPTMGEGNRKWIPMMMSLFAFIYLCNVPGIIPVVFMPATARLAIPLFLALVVTFTFIVAGFVKQGPKYITNVLFPPGMPKALYLLVAPIEFLSVFLVRPFSLTVRLFANLFAGHLLLVTFSLMTHSLMTADSFAGKPLGLLPFMMLMGITVFEVLVAFIQAYIFTILASMYVGESLNPEH